MRHATRSDDVAALQSASVPAAGAATSCVGVLLSACCRTVAVVAVAQGFAIIALPPHPGRLCQLVSATGFLAGQVFLTGGWTRARVSGAETDAAS